MFSKCAEFMEEGRRLENLSWRLWNRETFCVPPEQQQQRQRQQAQTETQTETQPETQTQTRDQPPRPRRQDTKELPELSTSVDSAASDEADRIETHIKCPPRTLECRPTIVGEESILSISRGREKHVTSTDLEKMVHNIKERRHLEPLEAQSQSQSQSNTAEQTTTLDITPRPTSPSPKSQALESDQPQQQVPEQVPEQKQETQQAPQQRPPPSPARQHQSSESCSTAPLDGNESEGPAAAASDTSMSSTDMVKSASVVRGFSPSHISSSYRSQPRLPSTTESPKTTRPDTPSPLKKQKKGGMFTLGSSSGDEASSFDDPAMVKPQRSSLTDGLHRATQPLPYKKVASFKRPEAQPIIKPPLRESVDADDAEDAIETDDEDDEEISESAIEDDDSSSEWEDSITESGDPNGVHADADDEQQKQFDQGQMFQRVDSRPNLVSRPSLITMMMHHQPQRNGAPPSGGTTLDGGTWSSSTPALQRSRMPSGANGQHSAASSSSPDDDDDDENTLTMKGPEVPRSRPIVAKPIPCRSVAHSPRTTRRNMLATELTESLRRHLLMERQQKTTSATQPFKRRHTAHDMANLQEYPAPGAGVHNNNEQPTTAAAARGRHNQTSKNNSWNHYFDCGPWEYHEKGW